MKPRLPPLSALRAFEAAARAGSFSAAGRELNVTHAAIGQQVRRLEAEIGAALLERAGRGVAPTPAGALLAASLTDAFARIWRAVEAAQSADERRPVRLTTTPSFASTWLTPRLGRLRDALPDLDLALGATSEVVDLGAEAIDLAIRYGAGDWPGLVTEMLAPSSFAVVAAPALIGSRPAETPADLLAFPWLEELGLGELADWMAREGVDVSDHAGTAYLPGGMMLEAVRAGQGIALTAHVLVAGDIAAGRLRLLFDARRDERPTGYHLVRRPGPMRPKAARLRAWLLAEAQGDPRLVERPAP